MRYLSHIFACVSILSICRQTKWYRPLSVPRSNQLSSSSNVAHLVDTFLTAQAVLDAEQTISKAVEPMLPITLSDSLQVIYLRFVCHHSTFLENSVKVLQSAFRRKLMMSDL